VVQGLNRAKTTGRFHAPDGYGRSSRRERPQGRNSTGPGIVRVGVIPAHAPKMAAHPATIRR